MVEADFWKEHPLVAIAKKLLSLALAIVGLVLMVVGLWFATHLGIGG